MLSETQILEIREHLDRAQNPIFYYDNDADGLCSYVLLRRFIGRGKGVAARSFPDLNVSYARKARELNADYVFVLDKPVLSKEFVAEIDSLGLPLVWIDHHEIIAEEWEKEFANLFIYNPERNLNGKSHEPVTYLCQKIAGRTEDLWISILGCIADHYLPDFSSEFGNQFPEFWGNVSGPEDAYFDTEIGRIAMSLNFGLKDSVTNVVKLQNLLINAISPSNVFEESASNYVFKKKYLDVKKKYDSLILKAQENVSENLVFFEYSGDLSISADLSNGLVHLYPDKYVVVVYRKEGVANMSLRGRNVRVVLARVLNVVAGSGGGHEMAVGARISAKDVDKFKEIFVREIENFKN